MLHVDDGEVVLVVHDPIEAWGALELDSFLWFAHKLHLHLVLRVLTTLAEDDDVEVLEHLDAHSQALPLTLIPELSVLCNVAPQPRGNSEDLSTVQVVDDDALLQVKVQQLSVHKVIVLVELCLQEIGLLRIVPRTADDVQLDLLV